MKNNGIYVRDYLNWLNSPDENRTVNFLIHYVREKKEIKFFLPFIQREIPSGACQGPLEAVNPDFEFISLHSKKWIKEQVEKRIAKAAGGL